MELYKEILVDIICKNPELIVVNSEELKGIFDSICYMALKKIQTILENDELSDIIIYINAVVALG